MYRRGPGLLSSIVVLAFALGGPGSASATSVPNGVFTLDAQVPFSIIGASGTIDPYDPGAEGSLENQYLNTLCLDGACGNPNDFSTQDWMVFRVTVTSGSLDEVGVGSLFQPANGVAYFTSLGGTAPTAGDATTNPNTPDWSFASLTGASAPLIAIFDAGDLPSLGGGPFGPGATNFVVRLGGSTNQVTGYVTTPIPESSTGLLVGCGLLTFAAARRRR